MRMRKLYSLSRPSLAAALLFALAFGEVRAAAVSGYWEYFVPGDEADLREVLNDLGPVNTSDGTTIIGVTAWTDETTLYYDHWENGYSFDPTDPGSSADEVVVLRASAVTTACSEDNDGTKTPDCQTSEGYHVFDSTDIPSTGWASGNGNGCQGAEVSGEEYCYDGRDRIFVAGGSVTLSRAGWRADPGSLQALAWEVYPVRPQLTTYILPFGEDLAATENDFDRVFAMVQATEDGTAVQIDFDGDGTFDPIDFDRDGDCDGTGEGATVTLDAGETLLVTRDSDGNGGSGCGTDGGLDTGTKVVGSKTLQAHYVVGDEGSTYEIRGLSAFPRGLWSKEYYAPVGDFDPSNPASNTDVFLHNPHSTALDISWATENGNGTVTVPPQSTISLEAQPGVGYLPNGSGAYFSADDVFWGVSTVDTEGQIFDWGYALVPSNILRDEYRLSWAPAYTPGAAFCDTAGETDQSGLFITPAQENTVLFVDDNGDGVADQTFTLSLLDSLYIEDSTFGSATERDLSNLYMWATGPFAAAWGQNPSNSGSGDSCALDMGYTILPSTDLGAVVLAADKESNPPLLDVGAGGTTEFTLTMRTGPYSVQGLVVEDPLPTGFSYIDDSTTIVFADGSTLSGNAADPAINGQLLSWTVENYSTGAGSLAENGIMTITFQASNGSAHSEGECVVNRTKACGTRNVNGVTQTFCAEDFENLCFSEYETAIVKDTLTADPVSPGDTIDYRVVVSNPNTDPSKTLTDVTIYDPLPPGVTYNADAALAHSGGDTCQVSPPPNFLRASAGCDLDQNETVTLTYSVTVDDPLAAGIDGILNVAYTNSAEIPLQISDDATNILVVPSSQTARVGDRVWIDTNGNGVVDLGEAGIPNVQVTLKDKWGTPVMTTTTDSQGRYLFTDVPLDEDYYVEVTGGLPGGLTQVPATGSNDRTGSFDLYEAGTVISLGSNRDEFGSESYNNSNATPEDWSGNSWIENGDDGSASGGDIQIDNGELRFDHDDNTLPSIARTLSVPTGATDATLTFDYRTSGNLENGDVFILQISTDGGNSFTTLQTWSNDSSGSDSLNIGSYLTATNTVIRFAITSGYDGNGEFMYIDDLNIAYTGIAPPPEYLDADLGYQPASGTAIIGDRVWSDADGDGVQDAGEPGLSGVTVRLYPDTNGDGTSDATAVNLVSGRLDLDGDGSITAADDGVVVDNGGSPRTVIDGKLDLDGDGVIESNGDDDGSVNLGGSTYTLDDGILSGGTDPTPAIPNYRTAVTAGNGNYQFNVQAGNGEDYVVRVDTGQAALTDYDATTQTSFSFVDVADGASLLTADVGVEQKSAGTTYDIQDRIWLDNGSGGGTADDGSQNGGESGIGGVTVDLLDASGNVIATATTDSNGDFSFTGVPAGVRYSWRITDQNGVLTDFYPTTTAATAGSFQMPDTLDEADDVADGTNDDDVNYSDPAGPVGYRPHFGYNLTRTIGDRVFNDLNGDGDDETGGDPGISGVTVELWRDSNNDGVFDSATDEYIGSQVTDANGNYLFSGLTQDETYFVDIDDSQAALGGFTDRTTADDETATGDQLEVTLNAAGDGCTVSGGAESAAACVAADFGYRASSPQSISGTLWNDNGAGTGTKEDGVIDADEPRFAGVTVDLIDCGAGTCSDGDETVIATQTTDANGNYTFSGIQGSGSEDYVVSVTDDDGVLSGYTTTYEGPNTDGTADDGVHDDEQAVANLSGPQTRNFGYYRDPVPTLALVRKLKAYAYGGNVIVEWRVSSEHGTLGYYLERLDEATGEYVALHKDLLPGFIEAPQGGTYWLLDPDSDTQAKQRIYRLIEVEIDDDRIVHGPFEIKVKNEKKGRRIVDAWDGERIQDLWDDGFARERKEPSAAQIAKWQAKQAKRAAKKVSKPKKAFKAGKSLLRIGVVEDGLYRLGVDEIAETLGVKAKLVRNYLKNGKLALSNGGEAVAYFRADDNSALYFYGQGVDTVYTDTNVYWLGVGQAWFMETVDAENDAPAPEGASFSTVARWEEDQLLATYPIGDPDGEYWYWGYASAGENGFVVDNLDAPGSLETGDAMVAVELRGGYGKTPEVDDHHVELWLNGRKVGEGHFDDDDRYSIDAWFDQEGPDAPKVKPTNNRLEIRALLEPGVTTSYFWIDRIELGYRRDLVADGDRLLLIPDGTEPVRVRGFGGDEIVLLDIADSRRPVLVNGLSEEDAGVHDLSFSPPTAGGTYFAATLATAMSPAGLEADETNKLKTRNNRADYLVIAPYALSDGAQALAELRQAEGLRTLVIDLQDIYNAFNHGVADAHAIRAFLDYAYHQWKRAPRYVAIAGKGTMDPRNFWGYGTNIVPVVLVDTPFGMASSDNRYADVAGGDGVPEMAIGRIPALTDEELLAYVDKLATSQAVRSASSDWHNRAVMVADIHPDPGGNFPESSESVIATLPSDMTVDRHYMPSGADDTAVEAFRSQLKDAIDAGTGLVNFIGHGSIDYIGKQVFFTADDVADLSNGARLPVFAMLTCVVGLDSYPGYDSLAGKLALHSSGGALAVLAPSSLSYNDPAVAFNRAFVDAAYSGPGVRIGEVVQAALAELSSIGGPRFMVDMYGIIGDPAVAIP